MEQPKAKLAISTNALALLNEDGTFKHLLIEGNDRHVVTIEASVDQLQNIIVACENAIETKTKAEIQFTNTILVFEPQYEKNTNLNTTKL